MANIDVTLKRYNGSGVDNIYPTTTWTQILNKPSTYTPTAHTHSNNEVGLGNVENYGVASQTEAEAGLVSNKYMTPERTKQAIDSIVGSGGSGGITYLVDQDINSAVTAVDVTGLNLVSGKTYYMELLYYSSGYPLIELHINANTTSSGYNYIYMYANNSGYVNAVQDASHDRFTIVDSVVTGVDTADGQRSRITIKMWIDEDGYFEYTANSYGTKETGNNEMTLSAGKTTFTVSSVSQLNITTSSGDINADSNIKIWEGN